MACIISIRTFDEGMLPTARRFFARVRTPLEVSRLTPAEIDALIVDSSYHERKAQQIHLLAQRVVDEYGWCWPSSLMKLRRTSAHRAGRGWMVL